MLTKIYRAICKAEVTVASVLLCSSVAVIFISSIMRTMNHPINWGTDIALLLFSWSTFLGADVAYRNNATVLVDIIIGHIPEKAARVMRLISYLLVLAFMVILVIWGTKLCVKSAARPFQAISWLSYSWVTASLPFSAVLIAITTLRKIYYEYIRHTEVPILENPDQKPWKGEAE